MVAERRQIVDVNFKMISDPNITEAADQKLRMELKKANTYGYFVSKGSPVLDIWKRKSRFSNNDHR